MIYNILELLKSANGETETIRIAQGKYKMPSSVGGVFKKFKTEAKWQKQ